MLILFSTSLFSLNIGNSALWRLLVVDDDRWSIEDIISGVVDT